MFSGRKPRWLTAAALAGVQLLLPSPGLAFRASDAPAQYLLHYFGLKLPELTLVLVAGGVFAGAVAMTRAMDRLVLTSARQRRHWNEIRMNRPSRFLDDIPTDFLAVRERVDPERRFTNDHLRHVLGD